MSKTLTKNVKTLATSFTEDLVTGDRIAFEDSKNAKELLQMGKGIVPEIGKYLDTLKEPLKEAHPLDSEEIKQGWIMLLCEIVKQEKITMSKLVTNFEQWVEWACNFKPE
jgi:hypothetical protein